jgi:hypothetical protein
MISDWTPIVHRVPRGTIRAITFDKEAPVKLPKPASLLPIEARDILINASQHMPRSQRVTAINKAINQVRKNHPQFFKEEI